MKDSSASPVNRPPDGNEAGAAWAWDRSGSGVDVFFVAGAMSMSWLEGRNYSEGRDNVVARWRGRGQGRSLLLSGHTDVAPAESEYWKGCHPYKPVLKNGRLYGRGSADMKGGLTAMFWAMCILQDLGFQPGADILFESVVDEEFAGGNGTLAARLRGHNADLAMIQAPTRMEVCPRVWGHSRRPDAYRSGRHGLHG